MKRNILLLGIIAINSLSFGRNTTDYVTKDQLEAEVVKQVRPHNDRLTQNANDIAENEKDIQRNYEDIYYNKQDINKNKKNILKNTKKLDNHSLKLKYHNQRIKENANAIAENEKDIQRNYEDIYYNKQDINKNKKNILKNRKKLNSHSKKLKEHNQRLLDAESLIKQNTDRLDDVEGIAYSNEARLNAHDIRLANVEKRSEQAINGVSAAVAMANLPTIGVGSMYSNNLSASYGFFGGSHSVAIGLSGITRNNRVSYKVSTAFNTKGDVAVGLGLGINFGIKKVASSEIIAKQAETIKDLQEKYLELKQIVEKLTNK